MYVHTLKRMMIGRTVVQKGTTVSVDIKEGQDLMKKGYVLAVKAPDPADVKFKVAKPKDKPSSTKDITEDKAD